MFIPFFGIVTFVSFLPVKKLMYIIKELNLLQSSGRDLVMI